MFKIYCTLFLTLNYFNKNFDSWTFIFACNHFLWEHFLHEFTVIIQDNKNYENIRKCRNIERDSVRNQDGKILFTKCLQLTWKHQRINDQRDKLTNGPMLLTCLLLVHPHQGDQISSILNAPLSTYPPYALDLPQNGQKWKTATHDTSLSQLPIVLS